MNGLLLAILSSALISILMRLSTNKVSANISMLAVNYFTCMLLAGAYMGVGGLLPQDSQLPKTLGMGALQGALYLLGFVLLQTNIRRNGLVMSSVFVKLGLLVPLVLSIFLYWELPSAAQWVGFVLAIGAIILMNVQKGTAAKKDPLLIVLLLSGGINDAMSKIFEESGAGALAPQFLFYTFLTALILCLGWMLINKQRLGKMELLFGFLIGIPNFYSARFLLQALETLEGVIVYPTYSVGTILIVALTGRLLFKEQLERRKWIGVAVILVALVLLNI